MLVLSRKLREVICIGDNITITVVDIDRGKIRLGITAPKDVVILREELRMPPKRDDVLRCSNCKDACGDGETLCPTCAELAEDIHF